MAGNRQYDHEYKVQAVKLAKEIGQAKAYQTRRRLSKNGEKATLWEQKRTASERQDLQSIRFISGGSRAYLKC